MPIDYKEYHPKWSLISRLIRFKRADNKCEWCKVRNGSVVKRLKDKFRPLSSDEWDMVHSSIKYGDHNMTTALKKHGFTKVVLTVAHLDHDKTNNRFDNLAALCQRCHLSHDLPHHINNRKYGRKWKRDQLSLNL